MISLAVLRPWILASRPKTLIATVAPISIGASLAYSDDMFATLNFVVALASALFIQIGTNLANDYHDFIKGADRADRVGPKRATQSGLISPGKVKLGFVSCFVVAAALGCYLIYDAGLVIFWVGLASILSGLAYTAGPWPLAYLGLGELFVLVFFGPVASGFTYYVLTHQFDAAAFILGLCPGLLSCAILIANNLRDIDQDAKSQKLTLAVRFGKYFSKVEYVAAWAAAYSLVFYMAISFGNRAWLLPLVTLPLALVLSRNVFHYRNPNDLIRALEGTAKTMALFTLLLCIGIML